MPQVRLIGPNGENVGVISTDEAQRMARDAELDLVEVAPNSDPPVCRVMDLGSLFTSVPKEGTRRRAKRRPKSRSRKSA